ncbi:hypothetical protein [Maridesulfovibrio frigidus]|uniref:hypothetical protein n=1 Tax=Maridesulfovibrio frigidus TaxID=340956 RepID=UPI00068D0435|nr:hypothetical protein [Maridesulfovibrio frigidus]
MKYILIIGAMLAGIFMVYSSNYFQSYIFPQEFYAEIFRAPLDVLKKGEKITIPIHFKYKTRYALYISLPDRYAFDDLRYEAGTLKYKFISQGQILKEGTTAQPQRRQVIVKGENSSVAILEFYLPFPKAQKDLALELEVTIPMEFLAKYSGKTYCTIVPNDSMK